MGKDFIRYRVGPFGYFCGVNFSSSVAPQQGDTITDPDISPIGNVDHRQIHTDPSDHGGVLPPNQDLPTIGEEPRIAIGIADGQHRNCRLTRRREGAFVAHTGPGRDRFEVDNFGGPGEGRF